MQTRTQFLSGLTTSNKVPECAVAECSICLEELEAAVELPCQHKYCKHCITEWLSRRSRATCPTCRRILFDVRGDVDRSPLGTDRLQVVARALEYSGLTTEDGFDHYSDEILFTTPPIHRAAAAAHRYLVDDTHPPVTGPVLIDIRSLGPHLIAMGNLLRGYAQAMGRGYGRYQRRDWKLIINHLLRNLDLANGQVRQGDGVIGMAREYGARVRGTLREETIDLNSGRFFESGARLQSPSGDLDVMLKYVVFQCAKAYTERETLRVELQRAQQAALDGESTKAGWMLRKVIQTVFGGV